MNLSAPFIHRPIATSLLMMALLLTGLLAFQYLPIASLPEMDYPTIQVLTYYPGASPEVSTSAITAPLERQFGQMPGLVNMNSHSSNGLSVITLQFALTINLDIAEQAVQAAINVATNYLPSNLPIPPVYSKINPADAPIMTLALTSNSLALRNVHHFAQTRLIPKLSQLSGVGLVSINGGQRPAIRIQANPLALSAYGLTLETIREAINTANVNGAKGSFNGEELAYTINDNDQLLTSDAYKALIISYQNNSPVRLEDVAIAEDGVENEYQAAWMNKQPAIILSIQRQPGANVIDVVNRVQAFLEQLTPTLPSTIQLSVLSDRTESIRASIHEVEFELLTSIALVVLVIFLFLQRLYATLIPAIVVPLTLVATFGVMYLMGFSLNNLTLMALTIATGFIVDDAIVMIENITRYKEQGETSRVAALTGAKQISFTIISLSLSLLAVLIPLLFMTDSIGRLFREFAITLAATIILSTLISLIITPMLCDQLLKKETPGKQSRVHTLSNYYFNQLLNRYQHSLTWALNHQRIITFIAIGSLLLAFSLFYSIPKGFIPNQDTGLIQGISQADESLSFQAMSKQQQLLTDIILTDPAVENVSSLIGIDGTNIIQTSGRILINLKARNVRGVSADEVIARLQNKLAILHGIRLYLQPIQDLTVDTQVSSARYQLNLSSPDLNQVNQWSKQLQLKLKQLPQLQDVTTNQHNSGRKTIIKVDRDTASRLGISMQMIDDALYDAFGQRQISILFTQRNQYRVVLGLLNSLQREPNALDFIYLNSTTGESVPLRSISELTQTNGAEVINRINQFPSVTLSFNLAPQVALGEAIQAIEQIIKQEPMPISVQTAFQGSAKVFQAALNHEGWLILAAIIVVYIVLGMLYESYVHPLTILSTLPSAGIGALIGLLISKNSLSLIALIGIILLIGIVMKNAIMMIDFALEQERNLAKSPKEAIFEACMMRFRPILMTTLASLFGALPLVFGYGIGSELRRPLGIAIVGGLLVSQLLTIYTTPVIYLIFDKLKHSSLQWWRNRYQTVNDSP